MVEYIQRSYPTMMTKGSGESASFVCFSAIPVTWSYSFNYNSVKKNVRYSVVNNEYTISIQSVTADYEGQYMCVGSDFKDDEYRAFFSISTLFINGNFKKRLAICIMQVEEIWDK